MTSPRTVALALVGALALLAGAGCGIPEQSEPQAVAADRIPAPLQALPSTPPTTLAGEGITESVFMLAKSSDEVHLVEVPSSFSSEPNPELLIRQLFALVDNTAALPRGVENSVPPNLALAEDDGERDGVTVDGNLVRIRLNDGLQNIQGPLLKEALAQIVWTATQTGGVERVQLLDEDDDAILVVGTNDEGAKEIVRRSDFSDLAPRP